MPVTPGRSSPERSKHENLHPHPESPRLLRREVWELLFICRLGDGRGTKRERYFKFPESKETMFYNFKFFLTKKNLMSDEQLNQV